MVPLLRAIGSGIQFKNKSPNVLVGIRTAGSSAG